MYKDNPEKDQDRVKDTFDLFESHGFVIYPQNKHMYLQLAPLLAGKRVIEAGCGVGVGTNILSKIATSIKGTDKLSKNVRFARELYPDLEFEVWDLNNPRIGAYDIAVAVEAIEHIGNWQAAIEHLTQVAKEVYFSVPNRNDQTLNQEQPRNPYHVHEPTTHEVLTLYPDAEILDWETLRTLPANTIINPVVYHLV